MQTKHKFTTAVRQETYQIIKEHADGPRAMGRFLDELILKAMEQGLLEQRKEATTE
jgi:hypothetical protein